MLPKIAFGAWAWGNEMLNAKLSEVTELESLADSFGIDAVSFWKKDMD